MTYDTTLGVLTRAFATSQANEDCGYLATYSLAVAQSSTILSQPSWLAADLVQRTITISQTTKQDVGTYDITVTATIPQVDPMTNSPLVASFVFKITIIDECLTTAFVSRTFAPILVKVSQGTVTQDLVANDTISQRHADSSYCGPKSFTISPLLPIFSMVGSALQVTSASPSDAGVTQVTVTISLPYYPGITSLVGTFSVTV